MAYPKSVRPDIIGLQKVRRWPTVRIFSYQFCRTFYNECVQLIATVYLAYDRVDLATKG